MRLVALLLGTLAVCAAGVVFSVYDYARHGSSTPTSTRALSVQPAADSAPSVPSQPAAATPPPVLAGLPEDAAGGTGPVALPPQEQPSDPSAQEDAAPAPPPDEPRAKDLHQGHGKHDHGGGGD